MKKRKMEKMKVVAKNAQKKRKKIAKMKRKTVKKKNHVCALIKAHQQRK